MNLSFTAFILDQTFTQVYPLDLFSAFIWTTNYYQSSEFQLEVPWNIKTYSYLKVGNYIYLSGSDELMIIETIGLTYHSDDAANRLIVAKGRALSSILDRRIVWGSWSFENSDLQTAMLSLVRSSIVSPSDSRRKISIIGIKENPYFPKIPYNGSGYCENVYEIVSEACKTNGCGFKVVYDDDELSNSFMLYEGLDRSYTQDDRNPVIFSSAYENLGLTRFGFDTKEYKTNAFVRGASDDGYTTVEVGAMELTGLDRREMYVSSSSTEPAAIAQKGLEELAKVNKLQSLDSEIDSKRQFIYGKDFFIGDIVQIVTDFGLDARARVTSFARVWDESGYQEVPTFEVLEV